MIPAEKAAPKPTDSKIEAIHQHLQKQFEGLTIKFSQEIDEIAELKEELRHDLELLKQQLDTACVNYCQTQEKTCLLAIEQFCKDCNQAINNYKKAPAGYTALTRNGIARETMDNIVARFSNSINSAINYTREYNDLNAFGEASTTIVLLESIKAKFFAHKKQINLNPEHLEQDDDSTSSPPPNAP